MIKILQFQGSFRNIDNVKGYAVLHFQGLNWIFTHFSCLSKHAEYYYFYRL